MFRQDAAPIADPVIRYADQLDKPTIKLVLLVLAFVLASSCAAARPERTATLVAPGIYNVDLIIPGLCVQDAQQFLDADAAVHAERLKCRAPRTEVTTATESTKPGKKKDGEGTPAPLEDSTRISGRLHCCCGGCVS